MILLFQLIHWFSVLRERFRSHFDVFWWPWGYFFWFLRVLETHLNLMIFEWSLGDPRREETCPEGGKMFIRGGTNKNLQVAISKLTRLKDSKLQTTRLTLTSKIQDAINTSKMQDANLPSQPGGPQGAGGYIYIYIYIYIYYYMYPIYPMCKIMGAFCHPVR